MTWPPERGQEYQSHYHMTPQMHKAQALSQLNLLSRHGYASAHPPTIRQKAQPSPGESVALSSDSKRLLRCCDIGLFPIADGYV